MGTQTVTAQKTGQTRIRNGIIENQFKYVMPTVLAGSYLIQACINGSTVCVDFPVNPVDPPSVTTTIGGGFGEGTFTDLVAKAPFVPTDDENQISQWPANTTQLISNGLVKVGVLNSIGGVCNLIAEDASSAANLVNTYNLGGNDPNGPDTGRSFFFSMYGTPNTGYDGVTSSDPGKDTGFNPNPGGDYYLNRPAVVHFQKKNVSSYGDVLYTRTRGYIWFPSATHSSGKAVNTTFHFWFWLEGKAIRYFIIVENNRTDTQMRFEGREQEGPGCYSIASLHQHRIYLGDAPKTNGTTTNVENFESGQSDTGGYLNAECWMGTTDADGSGLFLFTPYNSRFRGKQVGATSGNADSNETGYMSGAIMADMDNTSTTSYSGYVYVGNESGFRSWFNSLTIELRPFKFNFAGGKHQGFYSIDSRWKREDGKMVFHVGDTKIDQGNGSTVYGAKLHSPFGSWKASDINTIYINAAVSGTTELMLTWKKPGKDEENLSYVKRFPVINDGLARTYTISMQGVTGWTGTVNQVIITHTKHQSNGVTPEASAIVLPNWINTVNQQP